MILIKFSLSFVFNIYIYIYIYIIRSVGMKGPDKDIRPWVAPKDVKELEDRYILVKASRLLGR